MSTMPPPAERAYAVVDRPLTVAEGRSLYEALAEMRGEMRARVAAVDGKVDVLDRKIDTLITMQSHRGRQPSLAELAAEITGAHDLRRRSSTPPIAAWAQRGIGRIVIWAAGVAATLATGALLRDLWHLLWH